MIIWSSQSPSQNSFHICLELFAVNFSSDMNPNVTDLQSTAWPAHVAPSVHTIITTALWIQRILDSVLNQNRVQPDFGSYFPKP